MTYKGHDLDLRLLKDSMLPSRVEMTDGQAGGVYKKVFAPADRTRDRLTIWVDETVMTLCNQAHDLAKTLGAAEVGLKHLAHAMTQIEPTAASLYELNIHVSGLRMETTAMIMEDFPGTSRDGKSSPKKSDEFEQVLRNAAHLAYQRRSPVTTADIIDTLFDMSRDYPTRKILQRHRADFDLRPTKAHAEDEATRPRNQRRKVRISAGRNRIGEDVREPNGVPTVTDSIQNSRMDAIARAISELTESVRQHRSTFDELVGYEGDIIELPQPNGGNYEGDDELYDLVRRIERNVNAKFDELARTWAVLGDRLELLENALDGFDGFKGGFELTPEIEARLKTLSFADDRFDKFEKLLASMERRLEIIAETGGDGNFEMAPVMSSLRDVEAGLRGVGGQLREVDSRTGDVNLVVDGMRDQQHKLENLLEAQQEQINELSSVMREEMSQIGNALLGQSDGGERIKHLVESSLSGFSEERMAASINSVVADRIAGQSTQMLSKFAQLEEMIKRVAERPVVAGSSGDFDPSFLNDAVGKIINNQHTLAGSIDELRSQSHADVSALQARMEKFDRIPAPATGLPPERFEEISERLNQIQSNMPGRHATDWWTRFKIWLFGTSDWYAESWDGGREESRAWTPPQPTTEPGVPAAQNEPTSIFGDRQRA